MSWRIDSSAGGAIWDSEPLTTDDLVLRDEELMWMINQGRSQWKLVNGRIAKKGDPVANVGSYTSLAAFPPVQAQTSTAVTTATPGTAIWTSTIWSPILNNSVVAGSAFRISASGTIQSSTSSLTVTTLPVIGSVTVNTATGATPVTLGVSGAASLGSTLTAGWYLQGDLTIRSVGTSGTAWFVGTYTFTNTALPATNSATLQIFLGGTVATVDFTGATSNLPGGFGIGQWGAATVTVVTQQVHWQSL